LSGKIPSIRVQATERGKTMLKALWLEGQLAAPQVLADN
jgi:hypothetical protein